MVVGDSLSVTCRSNHATVPRSIASDVVLLTSIQAVAENPELVRNPVSLVVVLDRSFSMATGNKFELCKKTLNFLCREVLTENDRLGLVVFDSDVKIVFPCELMNTANQQKFLNEVSKLAVGDHTNLSAGLFKGLDMLKSLNTTEVSAVMLLSDGEMTSGITDRAKVLRMTSNFLQTFTNKPTIHSYGYGDTYDEVLKDLAEKSGGTFYHVENLERIPLAFADTLGGLLHVAAQNVVITAEIVSGAAEFSTDYTLTKCGNGPVERVSNRLCRLRMVDIYMGERKDILLKILVGGDIESKPIICNVSVQYIDVIKEMPVTLSSQAIVGRRADAPLSTLREEDEDVEVRRHKIRVEAANSLDTARIIAERGEITASRMEIERTLIRTTKAMEEMKLDVDGNDDMMVNIMGDLQNAKVMLQTTEESRAKYLPKASAVAMSNTSWSHSQQRSNNTCEEQCFMRASTLGAAPPPVAPSTFAAAAPTAARAPVKAAFLRSPYQVSSQVNMISKAKSSFGFSSE